MRYSAAVLAALVLVVGSVTPVSGQTWREVSKSRQNRGVDFLDVKIKYAVGNFSIKKGPDKLLYRLNSRYDEKIFKLRSNYLESDGRGRLSIDLESRDGIEIKKLKDYEYEAGEFQIDLPSSTPLSLSLELGAVKADLELGDLELEGLVLHTGASETHVSFNQPNRAVAEYCTFKAGAASFEVRGLGNSGCRRISVSGGVGALDLDFSGAWTSDATATINVGLGAIEVRVPAELGVRIDRSTFLMTFDAPGFDKQDGGVWLSPNWETASRRLTLSISGALGGVKVARR